MGKREITAISLGGVYLAACALALWHRLDAVLLFAVVSPVAASFMFPQGTGVYTRILIGTLIDSLLAALALVPVMGDLIDLGAGAVAFVLLIVRFRQFASSLPGGLACLVLYAFLWIEPSFLPHRLSVAAPHHASWFYPVIIIASVLAGGLILAALTMLLSLLYGRDRPKAIFCAIGFPWYLITFLLTIFLPNRHADQSHQSAEVARRI